ncbi:hypothetical protein DM01DRAFT_43775 [Hesseltinella vesiculosa]|uniref:Uncharacterized protein n=1 Tax=Hesseltinella vesiculosa TaxID=101127 RepID=A0A1X2GGW6_9FUNG|nr:hypothetical protein DM01DRAFT_43775 [Hesseltinella vesiculosa]
MNAGKSINGMYLNAVLLMYLMVVVYGVSVKSTQTNTPTRIAKTRVLSNVQKSMSRRSMRGSSVLPHCVPWCIDYAKSNGLHCP